MCIKKLTNRLIKKMKWYDISLLKGAVFFFTLFLITVWPQFRELILKIHWGWFLAIGIILAIPLMKKIFSK